MTDADRDQYEREIKLLHQLAEDAHERANEWRDEYAAFRSQNEVTLRKLRAMLIRHGACHLCNGLGYNPLDTVRKSCTRCGGTTLEPDVYAVIYEGVGDHQVVLPDGSVRGNPIVVESGDEL